MAKRFTATEKWGKEWFRKLSPVHKCLWEYLRDNCDASGVWEPDWELASFQIGQEVSQQMLSGLGDRVAILNNGKVLLTTFVEFQYGNLGNKSKAHLHVIKLLEKHGVAKSGYSIDRVSIGYAYPSGQGQGQGHNPSSVVNGESEGGNPAPIPPDRWTVEQFVAAAKPAGVTEADARQCYAHYQTQGWVLGNGRPIALGATPANLLARWNAKAAQQGQESSRSPGDDAPAKPPRPRARWQLKEDMAAVKERISKLAVGSPSGYASPEQWDRWRKTEAGKKHTALKAQLATLQEQFDAATE